jgi:hypothetical protein
MPIRFRSVPARTATVGALVGSLGSTTSVAYRISWPLHSLVVSVLEMHAQHVGVYANRTLYRDKVGSLWWKASALLSVIGWVLVALDGYSWVALGLASGLAAWQGGHAGVWVGEDDILVVHPVWGRKRVPWADIERFAVLPFNQWMIAWIITRAGDKIPCQGISSGRKRTQRVDVVVEKLNAMLASHDDRATSNGR